MKLPIQQTRNSLASRENHEVYYLDVNVPWGLIAVFLSFDPADSETITIFTRYVGDRPRISILRG